MPAPSRWVAEPPPSSRGRCRPMVVSDEDLAHECSPDRRRCGLPDDLRTLRRGAGERPEVQRCRLPALGAHRDRLGHRPGDVRRQTARRLRSAVQARQSHQSCPAGAGAGDHLRPSRRGRARNRDPRHDSREEPLLCGRSGGVALRLLGADQQGRRARLLSGAGGGRRHRRSGDRPLAGAGVPRHRLDDAHRPQVPPLAARVRLEAATALVLRHDDCGAAAAAALQPSCRQRPSRVDSDRRR